MRVWKVLGVVFGLLFGLGIGQAAAQGFLIPTRRHIKPLALKYHRVSVKLQDRAAKTTVEQVFVNHTNRLLEATYIFPLPPGAAVSNFVLYINGKPTKGSVLVKERAASIYRSIVSRMKDPGLIEYIGGNLFRARIFPIPRRGEQKLKISFTQVVPYRSGLHRYVYPLKASKGMARTISDFTMSVEVKSKTPLKNIYSPTHKVSIARRGERRAIVGFEKNQALLNRDFVLFYSVSPKDVGINVLSYRKKGEDGYFLMMVTPKTSYASRELPSKNITFVIDTSGSMSGAKMKWAKEALASCLKKLNPKDHFNVIRFSTDVEGLFSNLHPANGGNVKKALGFVGKLEAAGGTAIDEAMQMALKQKPKGDGVSLVVFLTDGHPTIGETAPNSILSRSRKTNKYKTRVFTFGIGTTINTKLLDSLAHQSHGTGDYVKPNKEILHRVAHFYDKVRYPVLTGIKMTASNKMRLRDIYPKRIPDLYRGGQLLLLGRYRNKGHVAITLSGKVNGKERKFVFEAHFPATSDKHEFIDRLWANRKVAYLLDNIRLHGENTELKGEVIRLAKKFGIVTPYTSYLAVEDKDRWRLTGRRNQAGRPMIQPGLQRFGSGRGGGGSFTRRFRRPPRRLAPRRRLAMRRKPRRSYAPPKAAQDPAASPVAAAPKPKPRISREDLNAKSGAKAVDVSNRLSRQKNTTTIQGTRGTRYVRGKLFLWKANGWVDKAYKASMRTLKIKYMSKAYFHLLRLKPKLRKILALGSRVTVVVGKNKALVIGPSGQAPSKTKLRSFLR